MGTQPVTAPPGTVKRAIGASAIGNGVEWFDYGIYAYGTVFIASALFPDDTAGILYTLVGLALSFVLRPLGGLVWGPLGDKLGRRRVLAMTIVLMASATFLVGLVPTYAAIGIGAPILLYSLRMIQGFSTGGEYGGAATFMAEYAPDHRRGFFGSFLEVGTLAGFNLGALLMLSLDWMLDDASMASWGWRVPFLIAGPLGLVGMYLRSKVEDTPVFRELEARDESLTSGEAIGTRLKDLFVGYWPQILQLFGLVIALNVVYYTLLTYMPTYLQDTIGLTSTQYLLVPIVGQFVMMIMLPFMGALSDKVGRKPMWLFSLLGLAVAVVPMYMLMATGFGGAMLAFAILGVLFTPQLATISATFPAMFPTHVRFGGLAISYNVATAAFGGTAPLINQALIDSTGDPLWPAYYSIGACVVGLVALWFVVETNGASLRGSQVPGTEASRRELAEVSG